MTMTIRGARRVTLGLSCAALALASTVAAAPQAVAATAYTINGTVACTSGAYVVKSVWVQANNGGSGFATVGGADVNLGFGRQRFTKNIPNGGTYWVAVNCGPTTFVPAKTVYTNTTSSRNPQLNCNNFPWWLDQVARRTGWWARAVLPPYGRCNGV
jgi:hypothetical protein